LGFGIGMGLWQMGWDKWDWDWDMGGMGYGILPIPLIRAASIISPTRCYRLRHTYKMMSSEVLSFLTMSASIYKIPLITISPLKVT